MNFLSGLRDAIVGSSAKPKSAQQEGKDDGGARSPVQTAAAAPTPTPATAASSSSSRSPPASAAVASSSSSSPAPASSSSSSSSSSSAVPLTSLSSPTELSTLLRIRECFVYAPPPRAGLEPYICEQWGLDKPIFTGELHVVAPRDGVTCQLRLVDGRSGALFAASVELDMQQLGKSVHLEQFLEGARDSSRYFVIRVKDARSGKSAALGIGFRERVSAFDLHAVLQDRARTIQRHAEFDANLGLHAGAGGGDAMGSDPAASMAALLDHERAQAEERAALARLEQSHVDLALPQGQRIKVVLRAQRGEGEQQGASAFGAADSAESSSSALSGPSSKAKSRRKHRSLASVEVAFTHGAGGALMLAPPPPPAPVHCAAEDPEPEAEVETEPQIEGWAPVAGAGAVAAAAAPSEGETDAPTNLSPLQVPAVAAPAAAAEPPLMQLEGGAPGGLQPGIAEAAAAAAAAAATATDDADDDDFGDFASAK